MYNANAGRPADPRPSGPGAGLGFHLPFQAPLGPARRKVGIVMPRPNPRPAPTPENTSSIETEATGNETIAERARQMAERIRRLPDELVASFALTDSRERVSRMRGIATELSFGMFPVFTWLERRRSADTAELVKRRLSLVLHEAVLCAGFEIPEYVGGLIKQNAGQTPSEGARRTAELTATSMFFAASLREWADDIQAEDRQRAQEKRPAKTGARSVKRAKKTEARDKWIWQQCSDGTPYKAILSKLKTCHEQNGWEPITSAQGIQSAARRYADCNQLDRPLPRQNR